MPFVGGSTVHGRDREAVAEAGVMLRRAFGAPSAAAQRGVRQPRCPGARSAYRCARHAHLLASPWRPALPELALALLEVVTVDPSPRERRGRRQGCCSRRQRCCSVPLAERPRNGLRSPCARGRPRTRPSWFARFGARASRGKSAPGDRRGRENSRIAGGRVLRERSRWASRRAAREGASGKRGRR